MSLVKKLKKATAFMLSAAMALGIGPVLPGAAGEAQAAVGTIAPSVTAYATKQQLMTEFTPNEDGTADKIVKLKFGKRETSADDPTKTDLEWYVLGKDDAVDGDNITIFAADPIVYNQVFQSSQEDIPYDSSKHGTYPEGATVENVAPNHYGASELREKLQSLAEDTNFFGEEEQSLLQETEVISVDIKNGSENGEYAEYTTSDKLYAPRRDELHENLIYVGSQEGRNIENNMYTDSNLSDSFWLRSLGTKADEEQTQAPFMKFGFGGWESSFEKETVRPVANINLSSVLFAAVAPIQEENLTEAGVISKDTPMILRINGIGMDIGTVSYDENTISATNKTTRKAVRLVVQGKNGRVEWYFSKEIEGTETISADDIADTLGTSVSGDIVLSACKVWIETSADDGSNIAYAVEATTNSTEKEHTTTVSDIATFATKSELMTEFTPNDDGTAENIAMIAFGKKYNFDYLSWYVLGKDDAVGEDNIVIFAASPMIESYVYQSSSDEITYDRNKHGTYEDDSSIETLYSCHYGASELREKLQVTAEDMDYFSPSEQDMLQPTEIKSWDEKNNVAYTITDELYIPAWGESESRKLHVGSNGSKKIAIDPYWWGDGSYAVQDAFWVHLFESWIGTDTRDVVSPRSLHGWVYYPTISYPVRPATNINISEVLFASAAKAPSSANKEASVIASGTAMALRLDGSDKNIGTVTYNENGIGAKSASEDADVTLVVQGRNGENDWYYSKKVTNEATMVKLSDIESALSSSITGDIDLSNCHIWLETPVEDGSLIYAVTATEHTHTYDGTYELDDDEHDRECTLDICPDKEDSHKDEGSQEYTKEVAADAYATKTQLRRAFTPNYDGTAENIAKIAFGKKDSSDDYGESNEKETLEWYVLGSDKNIAGDNISVFATSSMVESYAYQSSDDEIPYDSDKHGTYTGSSDIETLYPNHYGASELRAKLQELADDVDYFSPSEQRLLQPTEITSWDEKNNVGYTVTDKLYAAAWTGTESLTLRVGSNGRKKIAVNPYWSGDSQYSDGSFWIHLFEDFGRTDTIFTADPGNGIYGCGTWFTEGIRPATNINISDVIFASAAKAPSSDDTEASVIASGTAMALRLDGSNKNIGTVTYTESSIGAKSASEDANVTLVVQGRNGETDWYYSKKITNETVTVTVSDIESALGSSVNGDINLYNCYIWLETPVEEDGSLIYAVEATEHTHTYNVDMYKSDADEHYHECVSDICPDKEGSRKDAENHRFTQEIAEDAYIAAPATCTKKAIYHKVCEVCGAVSTGDSDTFEYGDAAGHEYDENWESDDAKHWKECVKTDCSDRDDSKSDEENHNFVAQVDEEYLVSEATCTEPAEYHKSCSVCGAEGTETFADEGSELGHDYSNGWTRLDEEHYKVCARCGCTDEAGEHEYDDDTDAECNVCGYNRAHEHALEYVEAMEPDCSTWTKGYKGHYECTEESCDMKFKDSLGIFEITDADIEIVPEHDTEKVAAVASTCTQEGTIEYYKCKTCGKKFADEAGEGDELSDADLVAEKKAHDTKVVAAVEATCTTDGQIEYYECKTCGKKFADKAGEGGELSDADLVVEKKAHDTKAVTAVAATCTTDGQIEYYECKTCGKKFADEAGEGTELSNADVIVAATGHTVSDTYKKNISAHWKICSVCGVTLDKNAHSYSGNRCTVCGYTKSSSGGSSGGGSSSGGSSGGGGGSSSGRGSGAGGPSGSSTGATGTSASTTGTQLKSAASTAPAAAAGSWQKDAKGWKYNFTSGGHAAGAQVKDALGRTTERLNWAKIGSIDFAFGADGYMKTGWVCDGTNGQWYYCDENKGKIGGWYQSAATKDWYYLDPVTGVMATGWRLIDGKWYYFATVQTPATGANGRAHELGSMYAGTTTPDNAVVDASGARVN